jgi:hypothetical protein
MPSPNSSRRVDFHRVATPVQRKPVCPPPHPRPDVLTSPTRWDRRPPERQYRDGRLPARTQPTQAEGLHGRAAYLASWTSNSGSATSWSRKG